MKFQLNKAPVCGLLLSLCSLHVFAYDPDAQPNTLGGAIGAALGGYIKHVIAPTNNNSMSSPQSDTTASSQVQPIQAAPMSAEDQAYFAKGLWHDPNTGLIWSLCRVGETWNGSSCDGKPAALDWLHAITAAKDSKLGGYDDWRIPSFSEYLAITTCPTGFDESIGGRSNIVKLNAVVNDTNGIGLKPCLPANSSEVRIKQFHSLPAYFSTITLMDDRIPAENFNRMEFIELTSTYKLDTNAAYPLLITTNGNSLRIDESNHEIHLRLVRGGNSKSYQQALQQTNVAINHPAVVAQAMQASRENLNRRTAQLRQNVKAGDQTAQGLVIEVKGNLVKVQTYKKICNMMSTTAYPFCVRYQTVVGDEEWFNRNQLNPVQ